MGVNGNGNGRRVSKALLHGLDRAVAENRELRRLLVTHRPGPVDRRCRLCGDRVCTCGFHDYPPGGAT